MNGLVGLRAFGVTLATVLLTSACAHTPTNSFGAPWWPNQPGVVPAGVDEPVDAAGTGRTRIPSIEQSPPVERASQATTKTASSPDAHGTGSNIANVGKTGADSAALMPVQGSAGANQYTQVSRYGDLVFISGQIAIDLSSSQFHAGTIQEEGRRALDNIRRLLEGRQLTMANVVSVTVYLRRLSDLRDFDAVYESYFKGALPSRAVVEVTNLPQGALVEIAAVAGR